MTPAARAQAAIEILDEILRDACHDAEHGPLLRGPGAEAVLIRWARAARYAGSGDRAAVRDLVFSALRRLRSSAALGGAPTGRGILAGLLTGQGQDPGGLFGGGRHGPAPLSEDERAAGRPLSEGEALDVPTWLLPELRRSLGTVMEPVCEALRNRAPVHLRANLLRTDRDDLIRALTDEGIEAVAHPLSPTAVAVLAGERRLRSAVPLRDGRAEPQDAASQAVADFVPLRPGMRVLDMCAGGGGKALALAARGADVSAWDVAPGRMKDIPKRAARAGARIELRDEPGRGWDLILCDAPCSGSGAWRRAPEGKWRLTSERLEELVAVQRRILADAAGRLAPGGLLVYATCSLLNRENDHPGSPLRSIRLTPLDGGDGFYAALFQP